MAFQKGVKCRRQVRHVGNPCRVLLGEAHQERDAANVSIANDETIRILCMLWLCLWLVAGASLAIHWWGNQTFPKLTSSLQHPSETLWMRSCHCIFVMACHGSERPQPPPQLKSMQFTLDAADHARENHMTPTQYFAAHVPPKQGGDPGPSPCRLSSQAS